MFSSCQSISNSISFLVWIWNRQRTEEKVYIEFWKILDNILGSIHWSLFDCGCAGRRNYPSALSLPSAGIHHLLWFSGWTVCAYSLTCSLIKIIWAELNCSLETIGFHYWVTLILAVAHTNILHGRSENTVISEHDCIVRCHWCLCLCF